MFQHGWRWPYSWQCLSILSLSLVIVSLMDKTVALERTSRKSWDILLSLRDVTLPRYPVRFSTKYIILPALPNAWGCECSWAVKDVFRKPEYFSYVFLCCSSENRGAFWPWCGRKSQYELSLKNTPKVQSLSINMRIWNDPHRCRELANVNRHLQEAPPPFPDLTPLFTSWKSGECWLDEQSFWRTTRF